MSFSEDDKLRTWFGHRAGDDSLR